MTEPTLHEMLLDRYKLLSLLKEAQEEIEEHLLCNSHCILTNRALGLAFIELNILDNTDNVNPEDVLLDSYFSSELSKNQDILDEFALAMRHVLSSEEEQILMIPSKGLKLFHCLFQLGMRYHVKLQSLARNTTDNN